MRRFVVALMLLVTSAVMAAPSSIPSADASTYVPTFAAKTGSGSGNMAVTVAYGAGVWVKNYTGNRPYYSTDGGDTWTQGVLGTPSATGGSYQSIEFVNGRFFALCRSSCTAGHQIQYSNDGIEWFRASVPNTNLPINDANWNDIAYGNGVLVVVGSGMISGAETANRVLRSTDNGLTWTTQTFPEINSFPLTYAGAGTVVYGKGLFVASGSKLMTSVDGITWTVQGNTGVADLAFGNGVFLGVALSGNGTNHLVRSTTGTSFSAVTTPTIAASGETTNVFRVRFGNGVFLFGASTYFLTTTDGTSFSVATKWRPTGSGQWRGLGFGAGVFMAVGDTDNALGTKTITSTDTPDSTAPSVTSYSPAAEDTGVFHKTNVVLTFDAPVQAGHTGEKFTFKRSADDSTIVSIDATSARITYSGSNVTIDPTDDLPAATAMYLLIDAGGVVDLAGNRFAGILTSTGYRFTTAADLTAPDAPQLPNLASSSDTGVSASDDITTDDTPSFAITTSEQGGTVTVRAQHATQTEKTCTFTPNVGATCTMATMGEGVWTVTARHQDASGNQSGWSPALTMTIDRTAPTLQSTSPARDAIGVDVSSNVTLVYDEPMGKGASGVVAVKSGAGTCPTTVESINVTSSSVSVSGNSVTVNPSADFTLGTVHCISFVAGVLRDIAGNNAPAHDPTASGGARFTSWLAAPVVSLAAASATSSSSALSFTLVASSGSIDCATISTANGGDFDFLAISTISVTQASPDTCAISATSTISGDGASGTSSLSEAASFSVSYSGSAPQNNISSGAPAAVAVSIPAASTTTTTTGPSTTTSVVQSTTTIASNVGVLASSTTTTVSTAVPETPTVTTTTLALAGAPSRATTTAEAAPAEARVDGDAAAFVEESLEIEGVSGSVTMGDGSTFSIGRNGSIKLRMRTGYIGYASGSVKASYKVSGTVRNWSCTIAKFRIGKINKKAKRTVGNWFPKKFYTVPNRCRLPAALMSSLSSQKVKLQGKVRFVKQWPTTGKAINALTNQKIPVGIRTLRITIGR